MRFVQCILIWTKFWVPICAIRPSFEDQFMRFVQQTSIWTKFWVSICLVSICLKRSECELVQGRHRHANLQKCIALAKRNRSYRASRSHTSAQVNMCTFANVRCNIDKSLCQRFALVKVLCTVPRLGVTYEEKAEHSTVPHTVELTQTDSSTQHREIQAKTHTDGHQMMAPHHTD